MYKRQLLYTPIIIEVSVKEQLGNNSQDSIWYTSNNKLKLGVPAPVKLLLNTAGKMLIFNEVQNGQISELSSIKKRASRT